MHQLNLGDKVKPHPGTSAIRKIAFDDVATSDSGSDSRRVSNKGDDFVMLDFKTPFSVGARPSSASDLQASVTAGTTDLVSETICIPGSVMVAVESSKICNKLLLGQRRKN
jgi:hypothetical protein